MVAVQGFPEKDARFSKLKNISDLLCDDEEVKIKENMDSKYVNNRASFLGNPVGWVLVRPTTKSRRT